MKVGTSGRAPERRAEVTPIAFSLPARICGSITGTSAAAMSTWPEIASVKAAAPPLYGMCRMSTPDCALRSFATYSSEAVAIVMRPGRARAAASNSRTFEKGAAGLAHTT